MSSINQFFSEIGCHFQCYNMGRIIQLVDKQTLIDFELNNTAWQSPFLQQSWLAIVFWQENAQTDKSKSDHYVWFLKLTLDEQAKLNLAARDDFLRRLFDALEHYLDDAQQNKHQTTADKLQSLESAMKDNPYGFQPKEAQMANFHAIVHQQLSLPASQYYPNTQEYMSGQNGFVQWNQLGLQGIADFAARLDESYNNGTNEQLIINNIRHLPLSPFQVLGACLENQAISKALTQAIYEKLSQTLEQRSKQENRHSALTSSEPLEIITVCITSIKASAQSRDQKLQIQLLTTVLKSIAGTDIEVLATIAGRCWQRIIHPEILSLFLEALANTTFINQGQSYTVEQEQVQRQGAFNAVLSDLMFIPGIRPHILEKFRSPERSEQLTQSIGAFFRQSF
ncbi:MAG: DUF3549 family protein [gamma proteobacterium symbiont of Bathyaustriella thionipta]|nr:DUF3549 family protein [gamma proteobacterium symbiont of Bathyaustriella thionipta]MCU7953483.1 DUF3549 family protein [gamma proteobacterium symbiont of Bathyaustriella thionipta]MCU7955568.1 DUF3549 family protein [gamma proteobacterium symbiont of Bathyaustriella thionipta]